MVTPVPFYYPQFETLEDALRYFGVKALLTYLSPPKEKSMVTLYKVNGKAKLVTHSAVILETGVNHLFKGGSPAALYQDGILFWIPETNKFEFGYRSLNNDKYICYSDDVQREVYWECAYV